MKERIAAILLCVLLLAPPAIVGFAVGYVCFRVANHIANCK